MAAPPALELMGPMPYPALQSMFDGLYPPGPREALHPFSAGGAYVNFMMDEGPDRVRATYGTNYQRLAALKAKYDPQNVFRVNQNVTPGP